MTHQPSTFTIDPREDNAYHAEYVEEVLVPAFLAARASNILIALFGLKHESDVPELTRISDVAANIEFCLTQVAPLKRLDAVLYEIASFYGGLGGSEQAHKAAAFTLVEIAYDLHASEDVVDYLRREAQ